MRALAILGMLVAACGVPLPQQPVVVAVEKPPCPSAYAAYEAAWRVARTDDLREHMAGYEELMEEILVSEVANLPSRAELAELREIYAVIEAFLWDAPWPRALAAADLAIARCGEQSLRP